MRKVRSFARASLVAMLLAIAGLSIYGQYAQQTAQMHTLAALSPQAPAADATEQDIATVITDRYRPVGNLLFVMLGLSLVSAVVSLALSGARLAADGQAAELGGLEEPVMGKTTLPTEDEREQIAHILHLALVELRYLEGKQAQDLAYAFHNVPEAMYGHGIWDPSAVKQMIKHYQSQYEGRIGVDYLDGFSKIFPENSPSCL